MLRTVWNIARWVLVTLVCLWIVSLLVPIGFKVTSSVWRWGFNSPNSSAPVDNPEPAAAKAPADNAVEAPVKMAAAPAVADNPNPNVNMVHTYSDNEYNYTSKEWNMDLGTVYGIEMVGEGFERVNTATSTVTFTVPDGYSAILFVDGMGNNRGTATFADNTSVRFDKGNATMVGDTIIIPAETKVEIPLAGNDSSGALVVLSKDVDMLYAYNAYKN